MATQTQKKKEKKLSVVERTEETFAKENEWQQYNSRTIFKGNDIENCLEELAKKTFPSDIENRKAYEEAIIKSLIETLNPEVGIRDFWGKMDEAGCKELAIENGHLYFYDKNGKKIDITPYTQPIVFEAHSSYYKQKVLEREQRIQDAKKQLQGLLEEINQNRY